MNQLYKYELNPGVVQYLLRSVESQQIRGEQQARDLVSVLEILRNPKNMADLEKDQLESLKAKYEPVAEEKKESKK